MNEPSELMKLRKLIKLYKDLDEDSYPIGDMKVFEATRREIWALEEELGIDDD